MPSIEWNLEAWGKAHPWSKAGDEWSSTWGGVEAQWWGCLMPRIHRFIPCGRILEIAPGFGRWTNQLKEYCQELVAVDLNQRCVEYCQERFKSDKHVRIVRNDGKSLDMVADGSVDFVFSFDSLVHAEADVIGAYLEQLAKKLSPDGVAFLHHSNAKARNLRYALGRLFPDPLRFRLMRAKILPMDHRRAFSMSAEVLEDLCATQGLQCIAQELINWGYVDRLDCLSTLTRKTSRWSRPNRVSENPQFLAEAASIRQGARLYSEWEKPVAVGEG